MTALSEVAEGIFELRLPIPFEDGLVNVFLFVDGTEVDLIDCGMNSEESVALIDTGLRYQLMTNAMNNEFHIVAQSIRRDL